MAIARMLVLLVALLLAGCGPQGETRINYDVGERVTLGSVTYLVVETGWRNQLGEMFQVRSPRNRFLVITLSVTNGGGSDMSIPLLELQASNGQTYQELADGAGLANWMGILRSVAPAETRQGRILFDVPLTSYKLRLPELNDSGYERFAWVEVPLRIDGETVQSPMPGPGDSMFK
jgi:hypothetical protein